MLQHEDIAKTQELKGKFNKVWVSSEYLQSHLNILGFDKIKSRFSWCNRRIVQRFETRLYRKQVKYPDISSCRLNTDRFGKTSRIN